MQSLFYSIGLIESSSQFSNKPPLSSHISGSKQIYGVWMTLNLLPSGTSILLHYFDASDYQAFIFDFQSSLFLGEGFILIPKIEMYYLTSS